MKRGICALLAATFFVMLPSSDAGEIVKKTFYNSKGEAVKKGYVYSAGKTRRSYERRSNRIHLPLGYGYRGYYPVRSYSRGCVIRPIGGSYCRPIRPYVASRPSGSSFGVWRGSSLGGGVSSVLRRR